MLLINFYSRVKFDQRFPYGDEQVLFAEFSQQINNRTLSQDHADVLIATGML